ncbi:MAG: hypothetical protein AAF560_12545 [Acidobacteriota bacterium]
MKALPTVLVAVGLWLTLPQTTPQAGALGNLPTWQISSNDVCHEPNMVCAEWFSGEAAPSLKCCIKWEDVGSPDVSACVRPIGLGSDDPLRDDTVP